MGVDYLEFITAVSRVREICYGFVTFAPPGDYDWVV
jgi:hypothetical protein